MTTIRLALLADGGSDRALVPIIRWTLSSADPSLEFAQPGFRVRRPSADIRTEMQSVVEEFAPDVLFVHRDAEAADPESRRQEIPDFGKPLVRVVPVRMTEAWLLFDVAAIRSASGNPNGRTAIPRPRMQQVEALPDPKAVLHSLLLTAGDVTGRRRKKLRRDLPATVFRTADLIRDFSPLRQLPAFQRFEADCRAFVSTL